MNKEEKILKLIKSRYKKKINLETKIFQVLDIDSFEFVNLVTLIQIKIKKKYIPNISENVSNITLKKFLSSFK